MSHPLVQEYQLAEPVRNGLVKANLSTTEDLRNELGSMLGATSSAWQDTFDHFSDNFQAHLRIGYQLPCDVTDTSKCVSVEQAEEMFWTEGWEWNYYRRTNPKVVEYIQLVEGLFIGEILSHFQATFDGENTAVYSHVFVHDGDIRPVRRALGINQLRWPAIGSNITFEIWRTAGENSGLFIRVLYCGQPVEIIHETLDWLLLKSLMAIWKTCFNRHRRYVQCIKKFLLLLHLRMRERRRGASSKISCATKVLHEAKIIQLQIISKLHLVYYDLRDVLRKNRGLMQKQIR
jgi:hypothetical protein